MKFSLFSLFILSLIYGCSTFRKLASQNSTAEKYYYKAFDILQNTTNNNTLSKDSSNQALKYINKAILLNPLESKYYRVKGTSYYHLKNYELALKNMNQALSLDSTNSVAWMNRAIIYENTTKYSLAEKDYLKALLYGKESTTLYLNFGLLYSKWGKDSLSLKSYDKAIEMDPKNVTAIGNRGNRRMIIGLYEEAISDFNLAISLDSTNMITYNNRGLCKFYLKQYEGAIDDLKKALSFNLDETFKENFDTEKYAYNNIGNSYWALGKNDDACKYWNLAISNGYVYQSEWKEIYNIDDPKELILKYCN